MATARFYYGWVLVVALGATATLSWGVLYYAFGVFLEPMGGSLGWSRGELTGAFSLALLVSGVAAVPVGRWLDRHGARLLMTVGSCCGPLLVLLWSRVADLGPFYLLRAAIGATMATTVLILGPIGDRLPLRGVAAGVMALQPLALLVLLLVPGPAGVAQFVVLFGAAKGGLTIIRPAFVAHLYGRAAYASVAGVLAFAATVAQAAAPVSMGAAYDALGRYEAILWALVAVSAAAVVALLPTRQRASPQPA